MSVIFSCGLDGVSTMTSFVSGCRAALRASVLVMSMKETVNPQGKLVSVADGVILDICVDVREGSDCYGKSYWYALSGSLAAQLWIPPGFAHGYLALSDAIVIYKTTQYRHEEFEVVIRYDDPALGLQLPDRVIVSEKDRNGILLADAPRVKV